MIDRPAPLTPARVTLLCSFLLLIFSFVLACAGGDRPGIFGDDDDVAGDDDFGIGDDDDVDGDDDDDDDDGDDDDAEEAFKIAGMAYIVPIYRAYDENNIWARYELEWTDIHPNGYMYGLMYIGVTPGFENTQENFIGVVPPSVPADPKNTGTAFLFEMDEWPLPEVAVMGIADTYMDGIISPLDHMAFHPNLLDTTGAPEKGADVYIDMEFVWENGQWVPVIPGGGGGGGGGGGWGDDDDGGGGGWGDDDDGGGGGWGDDDDGGGGGCDDDDDGGGGGWGDDDDGGGGGGDDDDGGGGGGDDDDDGACDDGDVDLSGHIFLHDSPYETRDARSLVAVYDQVLDGPWWTTLPGSLDGKAQGTMLPWELEVSCYYVANIYGAWDHNDNMLFEPMDDWGVTVTEVDGAEINPWYLAGVDYEDLMIQVPYALAPTPRPYILINGEITTDGTFEFADMPPGSMLYVLASRYYLPLLHQFPIHVLQGEDKIWTQDLVIEVHLQGDAIPYQVWAPSNSSMILHAAIDTDGDGYVESMYVIDGPDGAYPTNVGDTMMTLDLVMTTTP